MNSWILDVKHDEKTGDHFIELNDEILNGSGFKVGDTLKWVDNLDGSYTIMKTSMDDYVLMTKFIDNDTGRSAVVSKSTKDNTYIVDMFKNDELIHSRKLMNFTEDYAADCAENWVMYYGEFKDDNE